MTVSKQLDFATTYQCLKNSFDKIRIIPLKSCNSCLFYFLFFITLALKRRSFFSLFIRSYLSYKEMRITHLSSHHNYALLSQARLVNFLRSWVSIITSNNLNLLKFLLVYTFKTNSVGLVTFLWLDDLDDCIVQCRLKEKSCFEKVFPRRKIYFKTFKTRSDTNS